MSGVSGYTAPAGMSDLVSAVDAKGAIHCVYAGSGGLWHVAIDESLKPGKPAKIADGLVNPSAAVLKDGTVSVIAYDPGTKGFVEARSGAAGSFSVQPVGFGGVQIRDPYPCQAVRRDDQFLFVTAARSSDSQAAPEGLLFVRRGGTGSFSPAGSVGEIDSGRQIYRPSLVAPADGSLRLVVTNKGGYAQLAVVLPKRAELTPPANPPLGMTLNFGSVIDAGTGAGVIVDQTGALHDYPASGKPAKSDLKLTRDHHGQGANRRSLATAPDGTAVLFNGASRPPRRRGSAAPDAEI